MYTFFRLTSSNSMDVSIGAISYLGICVDCSNWYNLFFRHAFVDGLYWYHEFCIHMFLNIVSSSNQIIYWVTRFHEMFLDSYRKSTRFKQEGIGTSNKIFG